MPKLMEHALVFTIGCGFTLFASQRSGGSTAPAPAESTSLNITRVVTWEDAPVHRADWGEMRFHFRGQTGGTKDVLTATAIVQPGNAVHRAHRHAEEEYLLVTEGAGTWSVGGKEFPARKGDCLYVEPWVFHGLTNTGSSPLTFVVVRYNPKGVAIPPRPDPGPDER